MAAVRSEIPEGAEYWEAWASALLARHNWSYRKLEMAVLPGAPEVLMEPCGFSGEPGEWEEWQRFDSEAVLTVHSDGRSIAVLDAVEERRRACEFVAAIEGAAKGNLEERSAKDRRHG
jgi:hypothetical protein